jgi:hypothetical protein
MKEVKIVRFNPSLQADTVRHPVRHNTAEAEVILSELVNGGWHIIAAGGDNNAFVVLEKLS